MFLSYWQNPVLMKTWDTGLNSQKFSIKMQWNWLVSSCLLQPNFLRERINRFLLSTWTLDKFLSLNIPLNDGGAKKYARGRRIQCEHVYVSGCQERDLPFNELFARVVVDRLLGGRHVEHVVVREGLVLPQEDLRLRVRHRRTHLAHVDPLLSQLRPDPGKHIGNKKLNILSFHIS